jgi:DNA-binding GntR family transcriptional regulator
MPTSTRTPSTAEVVAKMLRDQIFSGKLLPGARLVEGKISEEIGVSRVPVREALHALASEGVVTIEPRKGAVVSSFSEQQIYELIEVRATLEALNAKLAAERHDPHQMEALNKILAEGTALTGRDNLARISKLNMAFHDALGMIGANTILRELLHSLRERTALIFKSTDDAYIAKNWQEHEAILKAVIAGDGELAALLASRHVYSAARISKT